MTKGIKSKLSLINSYWNEYYFSKKFFQDKINFTEDVQTNYYGDLNNYFNDTLPLIKPSDNMKSREEHISYYIVLLQVIYVQQDLVDELLRIFKLTESSREDKDPNRTIRNELIGHPISRDNNKLKSTILFDVMNFNSNTINYHKYSKENKFHPEKQNFNISEIISKHIQFLDKYLDKIIQKCNKEIKKYDKEIKKLSKIPFAKQFNFIDQLDPSLLSNIDHIFQKEYLEYYYKNIRKHRRYLYCLKQYKVTLNEIINEHIELNNSIDNLQFNEVEFLTLYDFYNNKSNNKLLDGCYNNVTNDRNIVSSNNKLLNDHYEIEQLYKKDSYFNIDFYIKQYKDDAIIYIELLNMKKNINNDKEYYASLNYLTYERGK